MDLTKVDQIIDDYAGEKSWLVMILQDAQEAYNYLLAPVLRRVACLGACALAPVMTVGVPAISDHRAPVGDDEARGGQ